VVPGSFAAPLSRVEGGRPPRWAVLEYLAGQLGGFSGFPCERTHTTRDSLL